MIPFETYLYYVLISESVITAMLVFGCINSGDYKKCETPKELLLGILAAHIISLFFSLLLITPVYLIALGVSK